MDSLHGRYTVCHTVSTMATKAKTTRRSREETRSSIVAAATELIRERSFPELSVGEVMERAGVERTLFYRHFDDLGDLFLRVGQESVEGLFETQIDLSTTRDGTGSKPEALGVAMWPVVAFYEHHGPLLRALSEAAVSEPRIAAGQQALRARFDDLAAQTLGELPQLADLTPAQVRELAHALNLLNSTYLLEAFGGGKPRVSAETAVETLTTIWTGVVFGPRPPAPPAD